MASFEIIGAIGAGEIGGEDHDARITVGEIGQLFAEDKGRQRRVGRADDRALVLQRKVIAGGAAKEGIDALPGIGLLGSWLATPCHLWTSAARRA